MGERYRATDTKLDREVETKQTPNGLGLPVRWNLRQVLECGNEVAAFGMNPDLSNNSELKKKSSAKAVIRCALTALQDARAKFKYPFPIINSTIAHYKVTAKLGQGGLGETSLSWT